MMGQAARDVGGYRATGKIGQGGMATVYKGVQVSLDRPVAIKVLSRKLSGDLELLERFNRESLIIARLTHPNIIHVIDRGVTASGQPYFVMEYVEGADLAALIREGSLDLNRKLDLVIQICKALSYAHKNGVIHRDIKPGNVLIDGEGNARVLDFGIAQFFGGEVGAGHTEAGTVMGTYAYMAPEQLADAGRVSAASDLYSLGALMYELFTGVTPGGRFEAPSELTPGLPKVLDEMVLQCLERDPARRFASADDVKNRLLTVLQGAHLQQAQRERAGTGIADSGQKFALLDVITEDRFGAVYLYENKADGNLFVIKKRPGRAAGLAEAKLLTRLRHENLVKVLGASSNDQMFIVVMEYVSGGSLRDRMIVPLPWGEVLRIGRQMAAGLAFAHHNRIVHGNLRPTNILFAEGGQVKLTDFGLDEHYGEATGTENWYAVAGEGRSVASDVFAAGVIFYQMLTGTRPRWEEGRLAPHHTFGAIPPDFRDLVARMLARSPAERYQSFDQVGAVLEELDAALLERRGAGRADEPTVIEFPQPVAEGETDPVPATPPRRRLPLGRLAVELVILVALAAAFSRFNKLEDLTALARSALGRLELWVAAVRGHLPF